MQSRLERLMRWFEGTGYVFALLVRVGLVSSAAIAAVLGQFALAGALVVLVVGISLRLWRLRRGRAEP